MAIKIYSIMSCIPSNDFVDWCAQHHLNYHYYRVYDPQFPQVAFDYTLDQVEELYKCDFYTFPIIYIDGLRYRSIAAAKEYLHEFYNLH